jgi:hypothetical protein
MHFNKTHSLLLLLCALFVAAACNKNSSSDPGPAPVTQ